MRSSTGRVNVPTPGPYSTNSLVFSQSTGPSILSISTRLDGMTDPTITGFLRKPRRNCQRGLGERRSCRRWRRRGLFMVRADEVGMKYPLVRRSRALANATSVCKVRNMNAGSARLIVCQPRDYYDEEVSLPLQAA